MTTPRRTIRMSDAEWTAGHTKAQSQGETLTEVMRRLLAGYLVDNASGLDYGVEYRAVPKDADSSLAVDGITGSFEDVRRIYPAKHWHLEERTVSPFKPVARGRGTNVPRQHSSNREGEGEEALPLESSPRLKPGDS